MADRACAGKSYYVRSYADVHVVAGCFDAPIRRAIATHVFRSIEQSSFSCFDRDPTCTSTTQAPTMKLQTTLAVAAACVATTAAFTVSRRPSSALQRQLTTASTAGRTYSSSALRMSAEADYVKGEIASADVS